MCEILLKSGSNKTRILLCDIETARKIDRVIISFISWVFDLIFDVMVGLTDRTKERARRTSRVSIVPLRHKSNELMNKTVYSKMIEITINKGTMWIYLLLLVSIYQVCLNYAFDDSNLLGLYWVSLLSHGKKYSEAPISLV